MFIIKKFDDSGSFVTVQNTIFMILSDLGSRNKDGNYRGPSIPLSLQIEIRSRHLVKQVLVKIPFRGLSGRKSYILEKSKI